MNPFTALPVWALFLTTVASSLLAVEVGFRLGRGRASPGHKETEKSVGTMVGYQLGLTSNRRTVASAILVVAFAVVVTLTAELDSVQSNVLRVNQQAMIEVQNYIQQHSSD